VSVAIGNVTGLSIQANELAGKRLEIARELVPRLMSYGPSYTERFRHAADYVDISKHVGRVNRESIVIDAVAA
jgi:hypothetical protein